MCLFLSRTPSLEYNIIHITLLSENKWNLLMIYFYFCRHVSIIIYINYIIFNGHGHYLIFSLCYCRRNVSPHCHMFTSIKGGGVGYPAHTEKCSVTISSTFAASAVTATQISPTSVAAGSCHVVFSEPEPNSAAIAMTMAQSQPTSIAFTLPMLLPLDPHYSWLWTKFCFWAIYIYQPIHESKYYISTKVGYAIA